VARPDRQLGLMVKPGLSAVEKALMQSRPGRFAVCSTGGRPEALRDRTGEEPDQPEVGARGTGVAGAVSAGQMGTFARSTRRPGAMAANARNGAAFLSCFYHSGIVDEVDVMDKVDDVDGHGTTVMCGVPQEGERLVIVTWRSQSIVSPSARQTGMSAPHCRRASMWRRHSCLRMHETLTRKRRVAAGTE